MNWQMQAESASQASVQRTHVRFGDWTGKRQILTIGTNAGSQALPFQTWRRFKEAFAPELVERALSETPGTVRHIADPFGGSGTTALAAQFFGVKPTTIEVNPFLADLIEAKIAPLDFDMATHAFKHVVEQAGKEGGPKRPVFPDAPATFVEPGRNGRYIFSLGVARRFLAHRAAINLVKDVACRRLFRVILTSISIPVSNVIVSGKGRRYRRNWQKRNNRSEIVDELFQHGVLQALHDLRRFAVRQCMDYRILRGDARILTDEIGPHDLAVFSPPYPNSFDYTDVYNVELWAGGYLCSREENMQLRHATLRSHVQILRNFDGGKICSITLENTINALCDVRNELWNRHIPEMIGGYAGDLAIVMAKLWKSLRPHGRVYVVVGNSRYAGIDIPVAKILMELAQSLGYSIVGQEPCRSMRLSPQQGGQQELEETLVIFQKC